MTNKSTLKKEKTHESTEPVKEAKKGKFRALKDILFGDISIRKGQIIDADLMELSEEDVNVLVNNVLIIKEG